MNPLVNSFLELFKDNEKAMKWSEVPLALNLEAVLDSIGPVRAEGTVLDLHEGFGLILGLENSEQLSCKGPYHNGSYECQSYDYVAYNELRKGEGKKIIVGGMAEGNALKVCHVQVGDYVSSQTYRQQK